MSDERTPPGQVPSKKLVDRLRGWYHNDDISTGDTVLLIGEAAGEIERLQRELDGTNKTIAHFMGPEGEKYIDRFAAMLAGPVSLEESIRRYSSPEPCAMLTPQEQHAIHNVLNFCKLNPSMSSTIDVTARTLLKGLLDRASQPPSVPPTFDEFVERLQRAGWTSPYDAQWEGVGKMYAELFGVDSTKALGRVSEPPGAAAVGLVCTETIRCGLQSGHAGPCDESFDVPF